MGYTPTKRRPPPPRPWQKKGESGYVSESEELKPGRIEARKGGKKKVEENENEAGKEGKKKVEEGG